MPASMSSAEAKPDSSIRMADSRYGMSSALTMKPARSWRADHVLAERRPSAKPSAAAVGLGEVSSDDTSSTSGSTGTGLKKWMPMTCSGRLVAMASFMIGIDEVLEARIGVGIA